MAGTKASKPKTIKPIGSLDLDYAAAKNELARQRQTIRSIRGLYADAKKRAGMKSQDITPDEARRLIKQSYAEELKDRTQEEHIDLTRSEKEMLYRIMDDYCDGWNDELIGRIIGDLIADEFWRLFGAKKRSPAKKKAK